MKPSEFLARIDERQIGIDEKLDEIIKDIKAMDGRLLKVEGWKERVGGIAVAVLLILGGTGTVTGLIIGLLTLLK